MDANGGEQQFGKLRVTRSGYTGEDGFEISVPHSIVGKVAEVLLKDSDVKLVGAFFCCCCCCC